LQEVVIDCQLKYLEFKKMKIDNELVGKEVIDDSGDQVGVVKDVEWDFDSKRVESIELEEGGISSKLGLGDKKIIPINMVKEIGDKVLIKGRLFK
jgi:sporulation protein YlmC with PRC-barrel domain